MFAVDVIAGGAIAVKASAGDMTAGDASKGRAINKVYVWMSSVNDIHNQGHIDNWAINGGMFWNRRYIRIYIAAQTDDIITICLIDDSYLALSTAAPSLDRWQSSLFIYVSLRAWSKNRWQCFASQSPQRIGGDYSKLRPVWILDQCVLNEGQ